MWRKTGDGQEFLYDVLKVQEPCGTGERSGIWQTKVALGEKLLAFCVYRQIFLCKLNLIMLS